MVTRGNKSLHNYVYKEGLSDREPDPKLQEVNGKRKDWSISNSAIEPLSYPMIPSSVFIYVLIPVILFIALLFPDSDMTTDSGEFYSPFQLPQRCNLLVEWIYMKVT